MTSNIIAVIVVLVIVITVIIRKLPKALPGQVQLPDYFEDVYSGAANHFLGWESVGGKLFLTKSSLYFKSHKFNFQNHDWKLNVNEIREVRYYNMLGIIRNMLEVETTDGKVERFVVNNRETWKAEIDKLIVNKTTGSIS